MLQAFIGMLALLNNTASFPGEASYVAAPGFPTSAFAYETTEVLIDAILMR